MRQKIVAGNWKMNCDLPQTLDLITELIKQVDATPACDVIIAPPSPFLYTAYEETRTSAITVAAQNMNAHTRGAHTGEVSASMLKSIGVDTVILGHSERRSIYGETDTQIASKVAAAIDAGMQVLFCFGEELKDRKNNEHEEVVKKQLKDGLFKLEDTAWENIVLAYEPVWAIGTGMTATPDQAQEMHEVIRQYVSSNINEDVASAVRILYGGSVKPNNAAEIFGKPDVDGGLIGGASLKATDFNAIIKAAY